MYSWEGLLDLENEKYVVSSGQDSSPLHLGVSVQRGQTPDAQPGAHLSPASYPGIALGLMGQPAFNNQLFRDYQSPPFLPQLGQL